MKKNKIKITSQTGVIAQESALVGEIDYSQTGIIQVPPSISENQLLVKEVDLGGEIDYSQDADCGFENVTSDCYAQPILQILQPLSRICQAADKPADAVAGKIYDPLSGNIYTYVDVIPCFFEKQYVEWKPQGQTDPLVAVHKTMPSSAIREGFKVRMPNGNTIAETNVHYILVLTEDWFFPALICMASTQIKISSRWNTMMRMLKPVTIVQNGIRRIIKKAAFSAVYRLSTTRESNGSHTWHSWKVEFSPREMMSDWYHSARGFYEQCKVTAPRTQESMKASYTEAVSTQANDFEDVEM